MQSTDTRHEAGIRAVSVVQPWVSALRLKQQAVLILALRGPDAVSKYDASKELTKFIRRAVMNPANLRYMGTSDGFFRPVVDVHEALGDFMADHDKLPHHFIMHLVHAYEILGYKHPDPRTAEFALTAYRGFADMLHMAPETEESLDERLGMGDYQKADYNVAHYRSGFGGV